jgi:hypothetical protein
MKTMAIVVPIALLSLVLTGSPLAEPIQPAQADSSPVTERARGRFHQGVQLFNEGGFEAALGEFRKAYQLTPSYRILFNIAQTYVELHDYVNAYRTLKQYLQEGGTEITPARRTQVDELYQKVVERVAYLEVTANVEGADIRVDDITVGTSPLAASVPVNSGPRRITAIKPGYAVASRAITLAGAESAKVALELAELGPSRTDQNTSGKELVGAVADTAEPTSPSQTGLILGLAATAGCAVATGVFGWLALSAKKDFDNELVKVPTTRDRIDSARRKTDTYAHLTDALGAATIISGAVALYLVLTSSDEPTRRTASVALAPTLGGAVVQGSW